MTPSNEDLQICSRCGGQCCLTRPGIEAPERFLTNGDLATNLSEALASGNWVLEEHIGIPYSAGTQSPNPHLIIRYPRPATVAEKPIPGWSPLPDTGACIFLQANGCQLDFKDRPRLCRELEPDVCFECESLWGRREAALAWLPHQDAVMNALEQIATNKGTDQ